jgi:hypothetical protein
MDPKVKRKYLEHCLEHGRSAIHVNTKYPGVVVPPDVIEKYGVNLQLNLSYRFGTRLTVTDDGVDANLSFNLTPYDCIIPWGAVWGISQDDNLNAFTLEMPPEIALKLKEAVEAREKKALEEAKAKEERAAKRAKFRVVRDDE